MFRYGPPPPQPKPERRVPASIALLARAKFDDMPLGGFAGEMLRPDPTPTIVTPSFQPPPPDWEAEERERREHGGSLAEPVASDPDVTAVEQMMSAAAERGELDEPRPLGPPVPPGGPYLPPPIPEPDWRQEEREREAQP
jgi:hypothetical protein